MRWRRQDLQRRIAVRFEVELHERTVGKYLAALGYRRLSVRPHHPRVDPEVQATFKKNFAETIDAALPEAARGNRSRSGSRTRRGSARRAR